MTLDIALLLFLATSPFLFLPAILSLFTKHAYRGWICAGNVVAWTLGLVSALSAAQDSGGFFLPIPVGLALWLGLLILAVRKPAPPAGRDGGGSE